MVLFLTYGGPAAANDLRDELRNIHNRKARLEQFSLNYVEEHPLERTVTVDISGSGRVTITVLALKPDCPKHWEKTCWEQTERVKAISEGKVLSIIQPFIKTSLLNLKSNPAVAPGSGRVSFVLRVQGFEDVSYTGSLDNADNHPGLKALVRSMREIVDN